MLPKGNFKIILILLLCLVINLSSQSQNCRYFIIKGEIISETDPIVNGSVQIIKNDSLSNNFQITERGRIRLELDYNAKYRLIFTQKGFLPKSVLVNTAVPLEALSHTSNYPPFLMALRLFKDNQDAANLYVGKMIQQISYSCQQDCFARVPTLLDMQYVENIETNQNLQIRIR